MYTRKKKTSRCRLNFSLFLLPWRNGAGVSSQRCTWVSARLDLVVCLPECVNVSKGNLCPRGSSGLFSTYLKKKSWIKIERFRHAKSSKRCKQYVWRRDVFKANCWVSRSPMEMLNIWNLMLEDVTQMSVIQVGHQVKSNYGWCCSKKGGETECFILGCKA